MNDDPTARDPIAEDARVEALEKRLKAAKEREEERNRPSAGSSAGDANYRMGNRVLGELIGGIGGGALISTYAVPRPLITWDLPWETLTGILLWAILWFNNGKLGKKSAIYLIVIYFIYILFRGFFFNIDF